MIWYYAKRPRCWGYLADTAAGPIYTAISRFGIRVRRRAGTTRSGRWQVVLDWPAWCAHRADDRRGRPAASAP
ncbi:hypothetical protein HBB16_19790 [Pseudonocardia sp. MCCB 268]|nr:hypothetical protein [Pseudonocardia cytotoxica]